MDNVGIGSWIVNEANMSSSFNNNNNREFS